MAELGHKRSNQEVGFSKPKKAKGATDTTKGPWHTLGKLELFVNVVRNLSREKRDVLKNLGFDFLTSYNTKTVKRTMCKWVIDHINLDTKELIIYGDKTVLSPKHVEWLLGFRNDGLYIEEGETIHGRESKELESLLYMDADEMAVELRKPTIELIKFKRLFILFVMTCICCPTVNAKPKKKWLHVIAQEDSLAHWNFAAFTLESTINAVREFKLKDSRTYLGGCPLLLMGIFCEYSVKTGLNDLWKYDLPRIRDWNDLNIKSLNESVESLPDGYKTNKFMTVIEKEKWKITGQVPTLHAQNVERSHHQILDKIEKLYDVLNFHFKYIQSVVGKPRDYRDEDENIDNQRRAEEKGKKMKGKLLQDYEDSDEFEKYNSSFGDSEPEKFMATTSANDAGKEIDDLTKPTIDDKGNHEDPNYPKVDEEPVDVMEKPKKKGRPPKKKGTPSKKDAVKRGPKTKMEKVYAIVKKCNPDWKALVDNVFNEEADAQELLIRSKWIDATRHNLKTLFPETWIVDHVIDLVGIRKTLNNPSTFYIHTRVKDAIRGHQKSGSNYLPYHPLINTSYLPTDPDTCKKIIIPMWIDRPNHWVVLVVYMEDRAIYLLDSLKERRSATRVNLAKKLIQTVSGMMSASKKTDPRLQRFSHISEWEILDVETPQQVNGSECGMHVIKVIEAENKQQWTSKEYFEDLDIYRIKTLVSLLEWDENFVKQHIAAGSSNLGE